MGNQNLRRFGLSRCRRLHHRFLLISLAPAILLIFAVGAVQVRAQGTPTNTPDAEGYIFVEVQPDDSLWAIAARADLTIPELLALNGLDESVVLRLGDRLIVGQVTPPDTPTPDVPTPTLPPPSATPTLAKLRTAMCVLAYHDLSQDGKLDAGEPLRSNVAFTIYNEQEVVANYITDGLSEPHCLEGLVPGSYHVTRSKTPNETLTTEGDWALTLSEGSVLNLAFGSYDEEQTPLEPTLDADQQLSTRLALTPAATAAMVATESGGSRRTWPLIIGLVLAILVLLVSLAVLIFLFIRIRRTDL